MGLSDLSDYELLAASPLFDAGFYLARNRDVAEAGVDPLEHYLTYGWRECRRPSLLFDGEWYARENVHICDANENPLVHYLRVGRHAGAVRSRRGVVYTAIVGNYDELKVPLSVDPDLDYVVFADDWLVDVPAPWIRLPVDTSPTSNRLRARYPKMHPHRVLPHYEISVWIDGAFDISVRLSRAEALLGTHAIAMFPHPDRDCAYEEAAAIMSAGLEPRELTEKTVALLREHGHPVHAGLSASGILIRRHHHPPLVDAMEHWWRLLNAGSGRDQLTLEMALRAHSVPVTSLRGSIWRNELGQWVGHRTLWNGLQCGGAYPDAAEYEALAGLLRDLHVESVVETGAGETSMLFATLNLKTLSIETTAGPWTDRARALGGEVALVPFDPAEAKFDERALSAALTPRPKVDMLFIDSPIGTRNRAGVLRQVLATTKVRYVGYHDARRDLVNIMADQQRFGLRPVTFINSPRGLAVFEVRAPQRTPGGPTART